MFQSVFVEIILTAIISLVAGLVPHLSDRLRLVLGMAKSSKTKSYSDRLASLMESLTKASSEVDNLLNELAEIAREREQAVKRLEADLPKLEAQEKHLQKRIQDLQNTPVPVAEYFAKLISQGEKRSAWRDYILFGLGVLVSTVIAIILHFAGLG